MTVTHDAPVDELSATLWERVVHGVTNEGWTPIILGSARSVTLDDIPPHAIVLVMEARRT